MDNPFDSVFWENTLPKLLTYANGLLKNCESFRGKNPDAFVKGKGAEDYVHEAVAEYLEKPEKYDPSKGPLIKFLKYYILRRLVSNDLKSSDNKLYVDLFSQQGDEGSTDAEVPVDIFLPLIRPSFDDELDYLQILHDIESLLAQDPVAVLIFQLVKRQGYKRREVIQQEQFNEGQFDNAMKKVERAIKKVALKYNIKQTL
jgi:hypothetical protein